MAGTQTDNLLLLDLTTGLARTPETGGTPDTINTSVDWEWIGGANVVIGGNLTVNGTTTTIHSEQVNLRDNHLYLNADYTTTVAQTGGLVLNVLPTATADSIAGSFVAGVAATSNPTVQTTGSGTFAVGDVIQISGANNQDNDGIFEVLSHVGTTLTIRGIGLTGATVPWVVNDFAADAASGGDVRIVNVNVLEGDSSGNWQTSTVNNTTGITYNTFTTQGVVDLQEAYEQGNTITTSGAEGNVTIAGTEEMTVTATGGINLDTVFDADVTVFDVQMTGSNGFSIDGTAASNVTVDAGDLALSTTTSGSVSVSSAGLVDVDATTTMAFNTADAADASTNNISFTAGSSTGGTADGASILLTPGDGNTTGTAGFVNIASPADEDEMLLQISSTGTNGNAVGFFTGTSAPGGVVTADAGSLFLRDTGAGAEAYLNISTGSGTTWSPLVAGSTTLQSSYEAGNTIVTDTTNGDFDVSGTEAISLDASAASNFSVAGASLTLSTTGSGNVDMTAADAVNVTAGNEAAAAGNNVAVMAGNGGGANDGGVVTLDAGASGGGAIGNGGNVELTGGNALSTNGDGGNIVLAPGANTGIGIHGFVDIAGSNNEDEALVRLSTTGTGGDSVSMYVGDNSPSGSVTAEAGSLFFRDTGTGGETWLNTSTGSGTTWIRLATTDDVGSTDLQTAYENGNTLVTDTTNGDFDVSGTEAISLDAGATSNFTVVGADLSLGTTTSGMVDVTSAGVLNLDSAADLSVNSSGGAINIGDDAVSQALNIGTGAAARTITMGNATGATSVAFDSGTGGYSFDATVAESVALVTLTTTGTNGDSTSLFVGDSSPDGSVTADASSLFFRDTGTSGELYLNTSTGSGTVWERVATTSDVDAVDLQSAYESGNTITTNATDGDFQVGGSESISMVVGGTANFGAVGAVGISSATSTMTVGSGTGDVELLAVSGEIDLSAQDIDLNALNSISLDAQAASNFTVSGANLSLSTTTSGTVDITSAEDIQMTFGANNATAMVIDDGTNTYMTFDSTTGEPAIEVDEFLDIVGNGAGITLTAGELISAGAVVTIEGTTGDAILADSNTGVTLDGLAIGIAAYGAANTDPVKVYTVPGSRVPVNFAAAPAASLNGRPVFVSTTPGQGTTTPPTSSGNVVYVIGILQGADGANTSPLVVYQPQFISVRP